VLGAVNLLPYLSCQLAWYFPLANFLIAPKLRLLLLFLLIEIFPLLNKSWLAIARQLHETYF
jgi:hypothetical protein